MIKINLIPVRPRRRLAITLPTLPGLGLLFGALCIAAVVLIGGYWILLSQEGGRIRKDIRRMDAEIAKHKVAIAEGNRFKKEKEDLERRLALVEVIARDQTRPIYLVDALADMVPPDLWVTSIEEKAKVLKIAGSAFSTTAVSDFMTNLENSGKFKEVDLLLSQQDLAKLPRLVTFEVTCRFDI